MEYFAHIFFFKLKFDKSNCENPIVMLGLVDMRVFFNTTIIDIFNYFFIIEKNFKC
jgi:hypothetical protein